MVLTDKITGATIPGDWEYADELHDDQGCDYCGAEAGQQCSYPDPDNEGLGIEVSQFVHTRRVYWREQDEAAKKIIEKILNERETS